jgi:hypothetical protein
VRRLLLVLLTLLASSNAGAQIIRSRYQLRAPAAWVSLGAAVQQSWSVTDGATGSRWEFGNATPYEASLEKALSGGASFGVRGSTGEVPLRYVGPLVTTEADANVSQLFGTLRVASGREFHTVLEFSAGATVYSNFRARSDGATLGPDHADADFSFAIGYGLGYFFSPAFSIDVVQDVTTSLHQKTGLSAGDDSSVRIHGTRIVGRIGLGGH